MRSITNTLKRQVTPMTKPLALKNAAQLFSSFGKNAASEGGTGLGALYRKELADHLNSKRCFLIFLLLLVTTGASLGGAVSTLSDSTESTEFLFLALFTTSGSSIYSFATFLAFLGPWWGSPWALTPWAASGPRAH